MEQDKTFADDSLFGSGRWVAHRLGKGYEWFRKTYPYMVQEYGFPQRHPGLKLWRKSDVNEWIAKGDAK